MMLATFNGNPSTTINFCYSITNAGDEMDLITFNNDLFSIICRIPKYNVLLIGGDMNVQIGRGENSIHKTNGGTSDRILTWK